MSKKKEGTFAVHLISISFDHYTFCVAGTPAQVVKHIKENVSERWDCIDQIHVASIGGVLEEELRKLLVKGSHGQ